MFIVVKKKIKKQKKKGERQITVVAFPRVFMYLPFNNLPHAHAIY